MKLMTPEECVNFNLNQHPSLYASSSYETAKLRIYDHIFNVIGNGIRNTSEFYEYLHSRVDGIQEPPTKYLTSDRLFYGYTEVEEFGDAEFKLTFGKTESCLDEVFTESEKADHPEVKHWMGFNVINDFKPYPNFQKQFSTVWKIDAKVLTPEWIDEIIWFYQKCEEFFDGPLAHEYHTAVPADPKKLESRIKGQDEFLAKYFKQGKTESEAWADITKDYGTEYLGDTLDFIQRRWQAEHTKIREFITETLTLLEGLKK